MDTTGINWKFVVKLDLLPRADIWHHINW